MSSLINILSVDLGMERTMKYKSRIRHASGYYILISEHRQILDNYKQAVDYCLWFLNLLPCRCVKLKGRGTLTCSRCVVVKETQSIVYGRFGKKSVVKKRRSSEKRK